jgi:hypothetical protein
MYKNDQLFQSKGRSERLKGEENNNKCQFHMVIPAENVPKEDRHCSQNGVRNILGLVDGNHVVLGFCEEHFHIVKQFIEEE